MMGKVNPLHRTHTHACIVEVQSTWCGIVDVLLIEQSQWLVTQRTEASSLALLILFVQYTLSFVVLNTQVEEY